MSADTPESAEKHVQPAEPPFGTISDSCDKDLERLKAILLAELKGTNNRNGLIVL